MLEVALGILVTVVLSVSTVLGQSSLSEVADAEAWVAHTQEVLESVEALLSTLTAAESSERGYLLTQSVMFLEPYDQAFAVVQAEAERVQGLVVDNPSEQEAVGRIRFLVNAKLAFHARALQLRNSNPDSYRGTEAAVDLIRSGEGERIMARLRAEIAQMQATERRLLEKRRARAAEAARTARLTSGGAFVVSLGTFAVFVALLERSHRKRMHIARELVQEGERLRTTLASIGDAVIVTDTRGRIELMNAVAHEITGVREDVSGRRLDEVLRLVNSESRATVDNPVAKVLREARTVGLANHTTVLAHDGREVPIDDSAAPILDAEGRTTGVVLVFRDVTEAKATEARLSYLASFPEDNPSPIVEIGPDGAVSYANPTALALFPDLLAEGATHPWVEGCRKVLEAARKNETGKLGPVERVVTVGGHAYKQVLSALAGGAVRAYGLDITDRVRAEEALERSRRSLEEADRRKDDFLAMLSHELRNPLTPIRNSTHILNKKEVGAEAMRRAQGVIERQVTHMTRLVDDLLDVTRIARGKVQLRWEAMDMAEVVARAVDDHRAEFVQSRIELCAQLPNGPIWVDGDRTRIVQSIGNLLQNAAKFTPPGGTVTVTLEADETRRQSTVRVRDTGEGIERDMLGRIFEPFTQADRTLDRTQGGLGLGLALVKGLVELHGGSVWVDSAGLGAGSEFVLSLPVAASGPEFLPASQTRRRSEPLPRVLVIEDNTDAAETLSELLSYEGYTVSIAFDGPSGLEAARAFRPGVILCDLGLPGMDGYEVAGAIRADATIGGARLVALSGYAGPDDVARARRAGFDAHLAKPPSLESIVAILSGENGDGRPKKGDGTAGS